MSEYILITGGAGFIGTNVARAYLERGQRVQLFDNLSRAEVEQNARELAAEFPGRVQLVGSDVRQKRELERAVEGASAVFHFAAQVAVTTSLEDPVRDAETNLIGTLNLLEALRRRGEDVPLLFTSTNKVYGCLAGVPLRKREARYEPEDEALAREGVSEKQALEFLSPYGCSKGSADQYVLDYARSYGICATVFRMSCIYGPYQRGSEDQGWVAHFLRRTLKGEPVTIFGDGKQVRDLLYVGDLVEAMRVAVENIESCAGEAFNIGGGAGHSASLLEVLREIQGLTGLHPEIRFSEARLGDQRWYVSNNSKAARVFGWRARTSVRQGLKNLMEWYSGRPELIGQSALQVV
ncbi:MAG TPA: SDR family NAD(P)-dependent oxidoreductase [Bryobacteraceae bacterium]|jgi:CDP-paratose 2-epimerase|nr:SDR family NAD(P)-dependent oxidoreductase [Bryobacteraceae bacterium]